MTLGPSSDPSLARACRKRHRAQRCFRIGFLGHYHHADAPHALGLLRPRSERAPRRRTAEQRDELAPFHSITSSAATSSLSDTVSPSPFAVVRLIASSNLVTRSTGRSVGLTPLSRRPVCRPARRYESGMLFP